MDMMDRHRVLLGQPHTETITGSGGLVTFTTGIQAPLRITASAGATVTACGKNLFDKNTLIVGEHIATDGSIAYNAYARMTGYIPIAGQCVYWAVKTGDSALRLGLYDANKGWIRRVLSSTVSPNLSVITINDPQVAYIRACIFVGSEDIDTAMIELDTTRTTFEAFHGSTSNQISQRGYNTVFADSGAVSVKYWTN